jgi:copper homeostasis protein CutC
MLQSGNQMEMQAAFTRLKNLYEQSRRDPAVLARAGISKSDIEAVYSLLTQE